jgi:holo-[acyl-carrier protein] synthase|tara:strand:- start:90 stop:443 length:354 start_codon:yes stop_codon:yes gene_type:complete
VIIGIGVDLCSVERLSSSIQRTPALADRLFTDKERSLKDESLAARFAAKEALAKAVGNPKLLSWLEVEVVTDQLGKPMLVLSGDSSRALSSMGVLSTHLSLSHDNGFAIAMVVLEGN